MSRSEQVTCDICGAVKKETNHWLVAWMAWGDGTFHLALTAPPDGDFADICGQKCAISALNNYLQTGSIEGRIVEAK